MCPDRHPAAAESPPEAPDPNLNPTDMTQKTLADAIIDGIQEKKGRGIVVCDLSRHEAAPARQFIVCTAGSPGQAEAVSDSVWEFARKLTGEKPAAVAGLDNAVWVAMDYGDVMVHILLPEARTHYDLEHIWPEADITAIPDLD